MKLPKLYRLVKTPLTQHDLERSKIAQFLLLCPALFHSALGTTKKWRGTVKNFPAPEIVPPLSNCFWRHWPQGAILDVFKLIVLNASFYGTVHGLFVPWTIRTLDYSYHRWTIFIPWTVRTVDCSYPPGLFVPWTVRTVPGRFVPC